MKEKKNIDRLFQEKFKDFEEHPSERVWQAIAERKKKNRRVIIPLWWKLGGIAAALAILFLLGQSLLDTNGEEVSPSLVNTDVDPDSNEEPIANEDDLIDQDDSIDANTVIANDDSKQPSSITGAIVEAGETEQDGTNVATQASVVRDSLENAKGTDTKERIALVSERVSNASKNDEVKSNSLTESTVASTQKDQPSGTNPLKGIQRKDPVSIAEADLPTQEEKSLLDIVQENTKKNAEAIAAEERQERLKRWSVSPLVAPVYYDSFEGSGIDPQFSDNSKNGDVNLSYGIQVSYAVNKRLTVRSGVNKVDLSYSTNGIGIAPGFEVREIRSIDYNDGGKLIEVTDMPGPQENDLAAARAEVGFPLQPTTGSISQRVGYFEVPVELEYALIDSKFGLQLIGGVSTLFLNDNEILVQEGGMFTTLGRSNSLNDVSFSTNVGLGLDYELSKNFNINLEPMFKYQLNAYNNTVSDFKPYYLGLYTGFSIKF